MENWLYILIALVLFVLVAKEFAANKEKLQDTMRKHRESVVNLQKSQAALKNFDPNMM